MNASLYFQKALSSQAPPVAPKHSFVSKPTGLAICHDLKHVASKYHCEALDICRDGSSFHSAYSIMLQGDDMDAGCGRHSNWLLASAVVCG